LKAETPSKPAAAEPPPIFIMPGPNGLVIASEDTAALDEFQRLLDTLTSGAQAATGGTTVFYLTHAKAAQAAETLERILAGTMSAPTSSTSGAAGSGSSVLGTLLQSGGGRRGPVHITPDERLNALIVQANPADVDTIEQMIRVLDQKEGPEEVAISPKPRLIPVTNKDAKEIADIVREVYADRMVQTPMQAARPMMMEAMAQMYAGAAAAQRGGGMGGGGGGRLGRRSDDQPKLALSVDVKSNSLIVVASDSLFQEVKQLVEQLDVMASEQKESIRVVTLHDTGSEAIRQALSAMAGPSARFTTVPGAGGTQQTAANMPPWMRGNGPGGAQTGAGGGAQPWQAGAFQPGQGRFGGGGRGGFGMGPGGGFGMGPGGGFGMGPGGGFGMGPGGGGFGMGPGGGMMFRQGGGFPGGGGGFPGGQFRGGGAATPVPGR
jgi:hypothetical protein